MAKSKGKGKRKATESSQPRPSKRTRTSTSEAKKPAIPDVITSFERFLERPDNDDRNKEAALYDYLGDEDSEVRNAAALAVTRGLLGRGDGDQPVSDVELQRHLERRLFRGLASGRNASRIGFSIVLTEVLSQLFGERALSEAQYKRFTFEKALTTLSENGPAGRSVSKSEETNYYLGQLFGLECFVKAKVVSADQTRWSSLLSRLLDISTKKVTLRSPCGWMIVQAVEQLSKSQAKETLEALISANLAKTPEGLAVWLAVMDRFPTVRKKPWKEPFSTKSLSGLAIVLRESAATTGSEGNAVAMPSNWTAQLHFVWDLIVKHFVKLGNESVDEFSSFWLKIVDDGFFSKTASPQRKFRGFLVFRKMIEGLSQHESLVASLLSNNFLSCLMNQAAQKERYLHNSALKALSLIEGVAESNPATVVPILKGLLGPSGMYAFDLRTKSKTIAKVLQCTREEDAKAVLAILEGPPKQSKGLDPEKRENLATEYVKYLHKLAIANPRSGSEPQGPSIAGLALDKLCSLAYAKPKTVSKYGMSSRTKDLCRVHLEPAFAKAVNSPSGFSQLCSAVAAIDLGAVEMDEEVEAKRDDALKNMRNLLSRESLGPSDKASQALALLYGAVLFQLYNEDPDAVERLSDLKEFHRRFQDEKDDASTTTFLIEALLSMLPRPSPLIRQVSKQVLEAFAPYLSFEALTLLVEPLSAEENSEGHKKLFAGEGEMEDDGSGDGSDDDSGDESEDSSTNSDAEQKAFDDNLAKVLRTHRLDEDENAPSDTESDMTDSEMIAIDDQLASAFKGRAAGLPPSKKDAREAKDAVIHFKHRVLDLVSLYLSCDSKKSGDALKLLPELVRLAATTSSKDLTTRASEIIFSYKAGQFKRDKERAAEDPAAVLQQIHDELGAESMAFAKMASVASLMLASVLHAQGKVEVARQIYQATAQAGKVHQSFFDSWQNWCQSMKIKT